MSLLRLNYTGWSSLAWVDNYAVHTSIELASPLAYTCLAFVIPGEALFYVSLAYLLHLL